MSELRVRYLNTDLDLISASDLEPLAAALATRGLQALHVTRGGDGQWYSTFESQADPHEPDANISAMLDAIESLDSELTRMWSECQLREFNVGYDCGDEPWAFNQGLTCQTVRRMAAVNVSFRVTIYPLRPAHGYNRSVFSFIETRIFTRLVGDYLTDDEYGELQQHLIGQPEAGNVIRGSGGLRKLRWRESGRGKRGGYRVIYYPKVAAGVIWMLTIYPKSVADSIPAHVLKQIRTEVENGE